MSKGSHDEIQWNMYAGVRAAEGLLSLFTLSPRNIQGKQDWNEKQRRAAFACWMSSLSSRAHCCRRAAGTCCELGGCRDQCGHTRLFPRAATLQCCSEPSAIAARALSSTEQDFWRGTRDAGCPDREEEVQGCWSTLLKLLEGHHKDVSINLSKATE